MSASLSSRPTLHIRHGTYETVNFLTRKRTVSLKSVAGHRSLVNHISCFILAQWAGRPVHDLGLAKGCGEQSCRLSQYCFLFFNITISHSGAFELEVWRGLVSEFTADLLLCLFQIKHICVQLPTYADNVALPVFARRFCSNRSLSLVLQQRVCCCGPMLGQTDGRTNGRTQYRFIDGAIEMRLLLLVVVVNYTAKILTLTTWHCLHLPFAATAIDWYLLSAGPQQQTCSSEFAAVGSCRDRQTAGWTDGRTPYRTIEPTYIGWRGTARIRPPLLQRSIDIFCPPGPQQQTCSRQTVGQPDTVPFHGPFSAYHSDNINNLNNRPTFSKLYCEVTTFCGILFMGHGVHCSRSLQESHL